MKYLMKMDADAFAAEIAARDAFILQLADRLAICSGLLTRCAERKKTKVIVPRPKAILECTRCQLRISYVYVEYFHLYSRVWCNRCRRMVNTR